MFRHIFLVGLLLLQVASLWAQLSNLDIGLYNKEEPQSVIISPDEGNYKVFANDVLVAELSQQGFIQVKVEGGKLKVKSLAGELGYFDKLFIKRAKWGNSLKIKSIIPSKPARSYSDNLTITPLGTKLKIVNNVYIENYISGVVQAEAGSKEQLEYYKVQSIICRTYALSHIRRHEAEDFHLCDKVHCQAYHGLANSNPDIIEGTIATGGLVLVDSDIKLITAAFSSNCGGITCNSEDVWSLALPYLRSVRDPYCYTEKHAFWETKITKTQWLNYLDKYYKFPTYDSVLVDKVLNFCPEGREKKLPPYNPYIETKTIRSDFKFASAFFIIDTEGDSVIFQGHGFGHGVGLCQEGAMRLAEMGVSYQDILHFYYTDVHLINLSQLDFFKK